MSGDLVRIDALDPVAPSWVWDGYIVRGGISLIVGAKGIGKTSFVCWLAAQASRGQPDFGSPQHVFIDSLEDEPSVVIRPRIEAAGADMTRITTRRPGAPAWKFPQKLEALNQHLDERAGSGEPLDLLIFDSLSAFVPGYLRPGEADQTLEDLTLLSQQYGCALLFIHHFNKNGRTIDSAIGGAAAITRVARTVYIFGLEPTHHTGDHLDDETGQETEAVEPARVLACNKLNIAEKPPALRFTSSTIDIPAIEKVHRLELVGTLTLSADSVFRQAGQPAPDATNASELETAITWLLDYLADGPQPTKQLVTDANANGISARTLERARAELQCQAIRPNQLREWLGDTRHDTLGEEERSIWWVALPQIPDAPPEDWTP